MNVIKTTNYMIFALIFETTTHPSLLILHIVLLKDVSVDFRWDTNPQPKHIWREVGVKLWMKSANNIRKAA